MESLSLTYPVLYCTQSLSQFQTAYVPTTVFTDGAGNVLLEEPVVGAKDRDG